MHFDLERVRRNARSAATEDLLDRVTVSRAGMEPEALEVIEKELRDRGVTAADIASHAERQQSAKVSRPDGPSGCTFCSKPAVSAGLGWHRLWGLVPLFPRYYYYCREHQPRKDTPPQREMG